MLFPDFAHHPVAKCLDLGNIPARLWKDQPIGVAGVDDPVERRYQPAIGDLLFGIGSDLVVQYDGSVWWGGKLAF